MRLEWDEAKNQTNIRKHGLDFSDAEEMFEGLVLFYPDTREDYGEERWIGLGFLGVRLAHVVFAQPKPDVIRLISLRKATSRERKRFQKAVQDRLEKG